MPVCAICGSSDFGEPQDGLYFCMECGTQSQDVRVEVSAAVEGGGFLRTLKRKSEVNKKASSQLVNNEHTLQTFQRILKLQCDALISLGLDPSLKEAARLIWFTYLRHFGYAFRDQPPTGTLACGDSQTSTSSGGIRQRKQRKETLPSWSSPNPKRAKTGRGFDSFPSDHLLFTEEDKEESEMEPQAKKAAGSESVPVMMEDLESWEQLEALERSLDCWQLYKFRVSNKLPGSSRPKLMPKNLYWGGRSAGIH